MDAAQERSGSPGFEENETSSNENLLHGVQRKRGQPAKSSRRRILEKLVGNNFSRPRQPHASNEEQDDAPRAGVEVETPSKNIIARLLFYQSSPSPCQPPNAKRKLKTPAGSGDLPIFKETCLDGSQQQPVSPIGAPVFSSPEKSSLYQHETGSTRHCGLQLGAGNQATLQDEPKALWPDSYAVNLNSAHGSVIASAPTERQHQSTSTQTFADLNDSLAESLLWKPSTLSTKSPLAQFLSDKKGGGNKPTRWLRHDLGLSSGGHLTSEEIKILTVMYLSLSGTACSVASALH